LGSGISSAHARQNNDANVRTGTSGGVVRCQADGRMMQLPRAMLIDLDDTILSAYGRPEIAWNFIASEFADEFAPLAPREVAAAIGESARVFWSTAEAAWRMKLTEARQEVVRGGFAALAASGPALSDDLAIRLADRFTAYRDEQMFVFPGAHETIDA